MHFHGRAVLSLPEALASVLHIVAPACSSGCLAVPATQTHKYPSQGGLTHFGITAYTKWLWRPFQARTPELSVIPSDWTRSFCSAPSFSYSGQIWIYSFVRLKGFPVHLAFEGEARWNGIGNIGDNMRSSSVRSPPNRTLGQLGFTEGHISLRRRRDWRWLFGFPSGCQDQKIQTVQLLMKGFLSSSSACEGCLFCVYNL